MAIANRNEVLRPGRSDRQQFNDSSFHRWYNFVLGFSDQLVKQLIDDMDVSSGDVVFDPFCGTGTTLIEAAKHRVSSIGLDANPFCMFAVSAKSCFSLDPEDLRRAAIRVEDRYYALLSTRKRFTNEVTHLYLNESGMVERGWISPKPLRKALALREAIKRGRKSDLACVLLLALVADLPQNIGNMRFGPQIYRGPAKEDVDLMPLFWGRVNAMIDDLSSSSKRNSFVRPTGIIGDARACDGALSSVYGKNIPKIDFVISSPPYPTEHDYTRHTRLELAFIESISTKGCLQGIKRSMVRSHTKGIYKGDDDESLVKGMHSIGDLAKRVQDAIEGRESGFEKLYPTVVRSYFGGMRRHFRSVYALMKSGGKAAYVVGDQAAYMRVPIRTAMLLGEVAESEGFKVSDISLWRQRWSTGISEYLDENILLLSKP